MPGAWTNKMAQQVEVLAANPASLSSIPKMHMVEAEN